MVMVARLEPPHLNSTLSGVLWRCCASSHLPKRELSPALSSPFHDPTRISCKEPRLEQRRSKTLPSPLPEQSEAANPNSTASQPKPASSGQLEHGNPPGQHLPSLKLNHQLMNISQRQTGQVDRVNDLFMSIREGKAVGRDIQAQPGRGHLPVKISWPRPLVQLMHISVLWACRQQPCQEMEMSHQFLPWRHTAMFPC